METDRRQVDKRTKMLGDLLENAVSELFSGAAVKAVEHLQSHANRSKRLERNKEYGLNLNLL